MQTMSQSCFILKRVSCSELKLDGAHVLHVSYSSVQPRSRSKSCNAELQSEIVKKYPLSTFRDCTTLIQSRLPVISENSSPPWFFCGGNIFGLGEEQLLLTYTVMDFV